MIETTIKHIRRMVNREDNELLTTNQWVSILQHGLLIIFTGLITLPVIIALIMSTQALSDIYEIFNFIPGSAGLSNYIHLLTEGNFDTYLLNSLVMSVIIVAGKISLALLGALGIVYFDFRFKNAVFLFVLFGLMLPLQVRIVPLYEMMVTIGWNDSLAAITIPYLASATAIFLFRQHFMSISDSLVENIKIDGVGPLKFLFYVLIPMSKEYIAGLSVILFIGAWNQYLWPLVVIDNNQQQVVQVAIKFLQSSDMQVPWAQIMAGSILALLPPFILLILLRNTLMDTLTFSSK